MQATPDLQCRRMRLPAGADTGHATRIIHHHAILNLRGRTESADTVRITEVYQEGGDFV
jgi:hypothetical protein